MKKLSVVMLLMFLFAIFTPCFAGEITKTSVTQVEKSQLVSADNTAYNSVTAGEELEDLETATVAIIVIGAIVVVSAAALAF